MVKVIGLLAFVGTGSGLILSSALQGANLGSGLFLTAVGSFYAVSLADHIKELKSGK